ncbi:Hint domain-containing protein, partial [Pararcticibacter amylolyticus]
SGFKWNPWAGGRISQEEWLARGGDPKLLATAVNPQFYSGGWVKKVTVTSTKTTPVNSNANSAGGINNVSQNESTLSGWEHLVGPGLIGLGQPIRALKPIGALGSKPGSSIASYTLSKALPRTFTKTLGKELGTKVATRIGTNVIGRALGRLVPWLGWGMTAYDVYDNREAIGEFVEGMIDVQWPNGAPNGVRTEEGSIIYVCFVAGTHIFTKEGLKPIERIAVGDSVYSFSFTKKSVCLNKVTKSFKRSSNEIYEVVTGSQTVLVTAEHPFYVIGRGWIRVKNLRNGDILKRLDNIEERIVNVVKKEKTESVFNIEVEGEHNYFVTDSKILVHNK